MDEETIKARIEQLQKELTEHQLELLRLDQTRQQLTNVILSKQGGIIELQQLLTRMAPPESTRMAPPESQATPTS